MRLPYCCCWCAGAVSSTTLATAAGTGRPLRPRGMTTTTGAGRGPGRTTDPWARLGARRLELVHQAESLLSPGKNSWAAVMGSASGPWFVVRHCQQRQMGAQLPCQPVRTRQHVSSRRQPGSRQRLQLCSREGRAAQTVAGGAESLGNSSARRLHSWKYALQMKGTCFGVCV